MQHNVLHYIFEGPFWNLNFDSTLSLSLFKKLASDLKGIVSIIFLTGPFIYL